MKSPAELAAAKAARDKELDQDFLEQMREAHREGHPYDPDCPRCVRHDDGPEHALRDDERQRR